VIVLVGAVAVETAIVFAVIKGELISTAELKVVCIAIGEGEWD